MIEIDSKLFPLSVVITLEELSVPHKIISPFGTIASPLFYGQCTILDTAPLRSKEPISVFGSCAILDYLSDKYHMLIPDHTLDLLDTRQWLYWYCTYVESFFENPAAEHDPLAGHLSRLDAQLEKRKFIARTYSIVDIIFYSVYRKLQDHSACRPLEHLKEWAARIERRPAIIRALEKQAAEG